MRVDGQEFPLPDGLRFVVPEFLAACVAARQLVDDTPYLVDLQRIAIIQAAQHPMPIALPK